MSVISDVVAQSLDSKFVKFDETGKIGPIRILTVDRVYADEGKYADQDGMSYQIGFEGDRILNTTSKRLMRCLQAVNANDVIEVTRSGSGKDTDYFVRVIERAQTQKTDVI
jgi:hypothetical protein